MFLRTFSGNPAAYSSVQRTAAYARGTAALRLPSAAAIVKSRSLSPRDFFLFRRQQARIPQFKAHFPAFLHISSPKPLHEQQNNCADNTESNRSHVFHHSQRLGLLGTTGAGQLDHLLRTRPIFVDSRSFAHRIRQADHLLQRNRVKIIARCRINRQPADTVKEA